MGAILIKQKGPEHRTKHCPITFILYSQCLPCLWPEPDHAKLSQSPPGPGCKNNTGVKGKPGTGWGILLKLINRQPTQTANHSFRYQEKEEHKQLNDHINIYPLPSTISVLYIFSTGYIQSSKISLGKGEVAGKLR